MRETAGPRVSSSPSSLRAGWQRLADRWRALEDSPLGDVIGAVSIGVILILFLLFSA